MILTTGCGQPGQIVGRQFRLMQSKEPVAPPPEIQVIAPPVIEPARVQKELKLKVEELTQTDILVVIDNSVSMLYEQSSMASRFKSFTKELGNLNWQLGIITTDVSEDAPLKDGRLLEFKSRPGEFILNSQMPADEVETAFAQTIQRPAREGSQFEQGIRATYRLLERKTDLVRSQGSLNVIVVSDADETPKTGTKPETRNRPADLLKYVQETYPNKAFYFHSLVVKENDIPCLKAENNEAYGRQYAWLSEKTGGVIGSVCEADYSSQLKLIGERVSQKVVMAELGCKPDPASLKIVSSQPEIQAPEFSVQETRLLFAEALKAGDWTISYECVN